MLAMYLTWSAGDVVEVVLTMVMITVAFGIFAAIPFIAERFVDDRRDPPE